MIKETQEEMDQRHAYISRNLKALFQIDDLRGIEVVAAVARVAQLFEMVDAQQFDIQGISMPRWRLMLHLFMGEHLGKHPEGMTPTDLSHFQQVSKNTISSLLKGLEEQGYIQRELDSDDLRVFRIRLTDAGRELILKTAPGRIESLNQMISALDDEERQALIRLLNKLRRSLEGQYCPAHKDPASRDL